MGKFGGSRNWLVLYSKGNEVMVIPKEVSEVRHAYFCRAPLSEALTPTSIEYAGDGINLVLSET